MSQRKCIYTGLPAKTTDKVIPKEGGDEVFNWNNSVPCSAEYKKIKARRQPNYQEMEAQRLFHKLESAKLDVQFYEGELDRLQAEIRKNHQIEEQSGTLEVEKPLKLKRRKKLTKEQEIDLAYKEKEIKEIDIKEIFEEKKKMSW